MVKNDDNITMNNNNDFSNNNDCSRSRVHYNVVKEACCCNG